MTAQQMHAIAIHTVSLDQKSSPATMADVMVGFGVSPSMCVLVGEVVLSLMLLLMAVTAPGKLCFVNASFTAVTDTTNLLLFAGMENAISTTTLIPARTNKRLSGTVEAVVAVTVVIRMAFVVTLYAIASDCTNSSSFSLNSAMDNCTVNINVSMKTMPFVNSSDTSPAGVLDRAMVSVILVVLMVSGAVVLFGNCVGVAVAVGVGVLLGVAVAIGVAVAVGVGVLLGVAVGVAVAVGVGVLLGVAVGVGVGVLLGVAVAVGVAIAVGVGVLLGVAVAVGMFMAVVVGVEFNENLLQQGKTSQAKTSKGVWVPCVVSCKMAWVVDIVA